MHPLYDEFISYLKAEDKDGCVRFVLSSLEKQSIDVTTLYNQILTPAMYADFCTEQEQEICIWKEHVRTAIVRTIIECCYPYIIKERDEKTGATSKGRVVVLCPPDEQHELGPRMVADFFTLFGFAVTFTGANVPVENVLNAIGYIKPDYIAISITNYYNLMVTKRLIDKIRKAQSDLSFSIILGGQACRENAEECRKIGADMVLDSFEEIEKLGRS